MYCDIKHLVMVTEEDGVKVEESSVKHEKIFLGEVRPLCLQQKGHATFLLKASLWHTYTYTPHSG